jgi:hypothetical protein
MCYEGEVAAGELVAVKCTTCGATAKLFEEDPDGIFSGAYPPLSRILALITAIVLSLLATQAAIFAVLAFGALIFLAVDVHQGHRKQRAERIDLWNRLRDAYGHLSARTKQIQEGFVDANGLSVEAKQERAVLAQKLEVAERALAEMSKRNEAISPLYEEANRERASLAQKLANHMHGIVRLAASPRGERHSLGDVIGAYKSAVSRDIGRREGQAIACPCRAGQNCGGRFGDMAPQLLGCDRARSEGLVQYPALYPIQSAEL